MPRLSFTVVLCLLLSACSIQRTAAMCPACPLLLPEQPIRLSSETERVYVLVPGVLGYGWEWNGVQIALAQVPLSATRVLEWEPWGSLAAGGETVRAGLQRLLRRLPPRTREVVVIGHSVGGLVVALAAARLRPPASLRLRVLTIGAPFAGTHLTLFDWPGSLHAPSPFSVGGVYTAWPAPARGVSLEVYPTTWPNDLVMRPRMGYDPGRTDTLPRGARLFSLPRGMDHNVAVVWVAERLAAEARGAVRSDP